MEQSDKTGPYQFLHSIASSQQWKQPILPALPQVNDKYCASKFFLWKAICHPPGDQATGSDRQCHAFGPAHPAKFPNMKEKGCQLRFNSAWYSGDYETPLLA